jgi:hypothetical protein
VPPSFSSNEAKEGKEREKEKEERQGWNEHFDTQSYLGNLPNLLFLLYSSFLLW